MTDLEITKLCAEAMGWIVKEETNGTRLKVYSLDGTVMYGIGEGWITAIWNPLHDDAQAMALVKKMGLGIYYEEDGWGCFKFHSSGPDPDIFTQNLNRAICECVAKMQYVKVKSELEAIERGG